MISLGHFWVISLGHFWVLFSRLFLNILTAAGGENAVVVQLTEEQLQLLISAEHLTHEVIKTHQQSSLNEIAPEMRSSAVISGMKAAYFVNLGTCVHLCAYFKLNFSNISDQSLTSSDCCNPHPDESKVRPTVQPIKKRKKQSVCQFAGQPTDRQKILVCWSVGWPVGDPKERKMLKTGSDRR